MCRDIVCAMSRHFFVHLVCRRWGDAICFNELHYTTPYHNTWDSPQQHEISYNPDGVVLVAPAGLNLGLWDMWCCFFVPSLGAVAGETGVLSGFISTAGLDRVCW